jgi:Domain of unknown function (DUF4476)
MKKRVLYLSLLLTITFSVSSMAATRSALSMMPDTPHKKIIRPTVAMTNDQAKDLLNLLRQKNTDAEKVTALKNGVKDKGITVDQLIPLLNQFNADNAKLDCAEYAYPYTVNYKAYARIQDLFALEKNKDILDDYVRKYK